MSEFGTRYGPVALVTGASSGIGRSFAVALAERGLDLVLTARRVERLEQLAADLKGAHGTSVTVLPADLGDPGAGQRILAATEDLDVGLVVSNAGAQHKGALESGDPAHLAHVVMVNCYAPTLLARGFVPRLKERGRGGIVLTSSVEGLLGVPFSATYSASKAYLNAFGEALWGELVRHGIDVLTLCPGPTDTEALTQNGVDTSTLDELSSPDEVARTTLEHLREGPTYVSSEHYTALFDRLLAMPRRDALRAMSGLMKAE